MGYLGVSKNRGIPKWMVKIMENPIKMDDFGGTTIFGNIHLEVLRVTNFFCLVILEDKNIDANGTNKSRVSK